MRNIKIIIILLIGFNFQVNAQFLKRPDDIKSPNAASLGKYGDLPVSYAYGAVDISVPIYSMNNKGIPLDLSLRYDASGVKINSPSGTVGMNWTLSTGGVITRRINDLADEVKATNISFNNDPIKRGYFYTFNNLNRSDWGLNALVDLAVKKGDVFKATDLMPDEFTFNFMGHTGKFFLGEDGNWKVKSDSNLDVIINESDFIIPLNFYNFSNLYGAYTYKTIGKISIKDDNGNIYTFGSNTNSVEYTCGNFYNQTVTNTFPSAWYLDDVKDRLGNTLYTFTYERGDPIVFMDATKRARGATYFFGSGQNGSMEYDTGGKFRGSGSLISPVYLSNIQSTTEKVLLNYSISNTLKYGDEIDLEDTYINGMGADSNGSGSSQWAGKLELLYKNFYLIPSGYQTLTQYQALCLGCTWKSFDNIIKWRKLDNITISKNYGTQTKNINLEYFEIPTERLFLKKVNFQDKLYNDTSSTYNYEFNYNNGNDTDIIFSDSPILPNYLHKGVDYWGYYNNWNDIRNLPNYEALRETSNDLFLLKKGSLRKIKYPTGGSTELELESNNYSSYQDFDTSGSITLNNANNTLTGGLRVKKIINTPNADSNKKEIIEYQYTQSINSSTSSGILEFKPYITTKPYYIYAAGSLDAPDGLAVIGQTSTNPIIPLTNFSGSNILYNKVFEKKTDDSGTFYTEYNFSDHSLYPDKNFVATLHPSHSIADTHISNSYMRSKLLSKKLFESSGNLIRSEENIFRTDIVSLEKMKLRGVDVVNTQNLYLMSAQGVESPYVFNYMYGNAYEIYYGDFDITKTITKDYLNNGTITTKINYDKRDFPYKNNGSDIFTGSRRTYGSTSTNSLGEILSNQLTYQFDCPAGTNCFDNPVGLPKTSKNYNGTTLLSQEDITYRTLNSDPKSLVIDTVKKVKGGNVDGQKINYTKYDVYGNILEYNMENGSFTAFIYDNTGADLLGKIENAKYNDLSSYLTTIMKSYNSSSSDAQEYLLDPVAYFNKRDLEIRNAFTQMRTNLINTMITSYTYDVSHRLKSMTSPNGMVQFFTYDGLDRLTKITDKDGSILKTIEYNFKK